MEWQGLEPEIYCGATSSQRGSDLPGVSSARCGLAFSGDRDGVSSSLCTLGKGEVCPWQLGTEPIAGGWLQHPQAANPLCLWGWGSLLPSPCPGLEFQMLGFRVVLVSPSTAACLCGHPGAGWDRGRSRARGAGRPEGKTFVGLCSFLT